MAERTVIGSIIHRHDTAANWEAKNPVIRDGEQIIVTTAAGAKRTKTGDGTKVYTQLPFDDEPLYNALGSKADKAVSITATLAADGWSEAEEAWTDQSSGESGSGTCFIQEVSHASIVADSNGRVSLPENSSLRVVNAAAAGALFVYKQKDGAITIGALGECPAIDIPILITLL